MFYYIFNRNLSSLVNLSTNFLKHSKSTLKFNKIRFRPESSYITVKFFSNQQIEVDKMAKGLTLNEVLEKLESFANTSLAEDWDNVGLLVEPATKKQISTVLLTNDLTLEVAREAVDLQCDLILTYHPLIFAPLKTIKQRNWKEQIIAICLENRIAVFSPHTSYDAIKGGVNDWLVSAFEAENVRPLSQSFSKTNPSASHLVEVSFPDSPHGTKALQEFQNLIDASGSSGETPSSPRRTQLLKLSTGDSKVSIECNKKELTNLAAAFQKTSVGEEQHRFKILEFQKLPIPGCGIGRILNLKTVKTVQECVEAVKKLTGLPHLRLALAIGKDFASEVRTIAICAGSGASVLKGVEADLYLTGEMLHHDLLEATHRGSHVILCNHSDSERGFLRVFAPKLQTEIFSDQLRVVVSRTDRDPLQTV